MTLPLLLKKENIKLTIGISTFEVPPFLPAVLVKILNKISPTLKTSVIKRQVADIAYNMLGIDFFVSYTPLDNHLQHAIILDEDNYVVVISNSLLESFLR